MFPKQLEERLLTTSNVIVFPSEVAAAFWRRHILAHTDKAALRNDAVLSWDAFKERHFGRRLALRPVNSLQRTIFALEFLGAHRSAPRLSVLVPKRYASESRRFLTNLRSVLPMLPTLLELSRAHQVEDLAGDLSTVHDAYCDYLAEVGCFEPAWVGVDAPAVETPHLLLFPELLTDFAEFRDAIVGAPNIEILPVAQAAGEGAPTAPTDGDTSARTLEQFADSRREVDALFARIEWLLDAGVPPSNIAITVGNLDELAELLVQESGRREVPLSLRRGRPLADYPAGRLFFSLGACRRGRYSLASMKALLLDRGIPWRDRRVAELLIELGADTGCLANGVGDAWRSALDRASPRLTSDGVNARRSELKELYRAVSGAAGSMVSAKSFAAIKQQLYLLVRTVIDTDRFDDTNERVFQRCVEVLDDLTEVSAGRPVADPFELFLIVLREQVYVPRETAGGIGVYPYRVSAGIAPAHHFIVNASRRNTDVQVAPFPFLSDLLRERLEVTTEDATEAFWDVYLLSGHSVQASYSELTPSGPQLAPGRFIADSTVVPGDLAAEPPYKAERRWWSGESPAVERIYPAQARGYRHAAAAAFVDRGTDLTEHPITDPDIVRQFVRAQSRPRPGDDETALLGISPTHLESFLACPFSYLFSRVLGLKERSFEADIESALDLGSFYHRVLQIQFARQRTRDQAISLTEVETVVAEIREIAEDEARTWAATNTALHPIVLRSRLSSIVDDLAHLVRDQTTRLNGYKVEATEHWYDAVLEQEAVNLYGKIDRIDRNTAGGEYVLLDYKKKGVPTRGEVTGLSGNGRTVEPSSYQIPFYLYLAEANELSVEEAGYESIERRCYTSVYGEAKSSYFNDEEKYEIMNRLIRMVRLMAERITGGDYRCPEDTCDGCAFRGLCRRKFVIRY